MDVLDKFWQSGEGLDQIIPVADRMRRGEAHPLDAIHLTNRLEQLNEGTFAIDLRKLVPPVKVHDLAKERDLFDPAFGQRADFGDDLLDRPTAFEVAPNPDALKMALKGINVSSPGIL